MDDMTMATCRRNSWWAAAVAGLLVAAMLFFVAQQGFFSALLTGGVAAVLLGFFLVWAFCSSADRRAEVAAPSRPSPIHAAGSTAAPAPEPVGAVAAEPAAPPPAPAATAAQTERAADSAAVAAAVPLMATAPQPKPAPRKPAAKAAPKAKAAAPAKPATKPRVKAGSALDAALAKSKEPVTRAGPELLKAPRGGKADDLKVIVGVGPKLEKLLNDLGVWHFDQIAGWKAKDIAFVDDKMEGFKGRITRDEWVKQAKVLAKGRAS